MGMDGRPLDTRADGRLDAEHVGQQVLGDDLGRRSPVVRRAVLQRGEVVGEPAACETSWRTITTVTPRSRFGVRTVSSTFNRWRGPRNVVGASVRADGASPGAVVR